MTSQPIQALLGSLSTTTTCSAHDKHCWDEAGRWLDLITSRCSGNEPTLFPPQQRRVTPINQTTHLFLGRNKIGPESARKI